ncbi:MAG: YihA family ribosome biogenesis GTP-binding protein [Robiginitomaculum sp.]|nr:MAG: YihA family ribosome biogenesis GTP-binding protein [Robiginitomaculum sp.]
MTEAARAEDFDPTELEAARVFFSRPCDFVMGAVSLDSLPPGNLPEVAFAGRSNVGKSSLLNALTFRKNLARSSNTPGRTRELNFFNLDDRLMLADLPGYGYARASKNAIEKWSALTRDYLRGRAALRRVFVLVDSRHGIKPSDLAVMDMLDEAAAVYQIVLTKLDKIKQNERQTVLERTQKALEKRAAAFPRVAAVSSVKGYGMAELRADVFSLV